MPLYNILLGFQYVSVALMIYLCAYIIRKWSQPVHAWLFFYCVATLVNSAGYLTIMHAQTEREAMLIWQFIYLGRTWVPFTAFIFVLIACTGKSYSKITTPLSLIHVVSYLCVLTMRHNPLFYKTFGFTEDGIFPHVIYTPGVWHYLHDFVCFCYAAIGLTLLIYSLKKESNPWKKKRFIFLIIEVFFLSFFWACEVLKLVPGYDLNVIGYTLVAVLFYIAFFVFHALDATQLNDAVVVSDAAEPKDEAKVKIEAFGDADRRIKIPFNEILYFEADAEQVFVYTAVEIYKVKLRLYQVEEMSQKTGIIRVSKSHLVNVKKIQSVRPTMNSRLYVKMANGEEVLVSRKYAHTLKQAIS